MIVGAAGEPGLRRGAGRSGEYAFFWGGQSGSIRSDALAVDTSKLYELTGWFKTEKPAEAGSDDGGFVSVMFGLVPEEKNLRSAFASGQLDAKQKRGKWIAMVARDIPAGEWTEIKLTVSPKQWWPGVDRIQVLVSPKRMGGAKALWMDDLALRAVE